MWAGQWYICLAELKEVNFEQICWQCYHCWKRFDSFGELLSSLEITNSKFSTSELLITSESGEQIFKNKEYGCWNANRKWRREVEKRNRRGLSQKNIKFFVGLSISVIHNTYYYRYNRSHFCTLDHFQVPKARTHMNVVCILGCVICMW